MDIRGPAPVFEIQLSQLAICQIETWWTVIGYDRAALEPLAFERCSIDQLKSIDTHLDVDDILCDKSGHGGGADVMECGTGGCCAQDGPLQTCEVVGPALARRMDFYRHGALAIVEP